MNAYSRRTPLRSRPGDRQPAPPAHALPVLGILTLYLNEKGLIEDRHVYRRMTVEGRRMGLSVIVFTPDDVDERGARIRAHRYDCDRKRWIRGTVPFPQVIYDRCRIQRSARFRRLLQFRTQYGHLTYLNRPLRNKWTVYRALAREDNFRSHLPETRIYEGPDDLKAMVGRYPLVYLKPVNGTGGRGILRVERSRQPLLIVQGREQSRRIIAPRRMTTAALAGLVAAWNRTGGGKYIVQQGIQLKLANGRVHDYRLLVQKNGDGEWEATGCAGRIGASGSVTSNLHGGGRAAPMDELLPRWIGDREKAADVKEKASKLGTAVASYLEKTYGSLCELALDLAIDRSGHIWLLEVNPKPSREVFARIGDAATYRKAIVRPLEYALWLYRSSKGKQES